MSRLPLAAAALLFLAGSVWTTEVNITEAADDWCAKYATCSLHDDDGPWMSVLQQWALTAPMHSERQGRIMALPPAQGYYVTDRIGSPVLTPPPPPHHGNHPNHPLPPGGRPYDEWQHSPPLPPTTGKIVNRPPNPYKDKFKPSPSYPVQNQPIPVHSHAVDRVDENRQPPQKQVSETDLYLLGAIEKLVWRADLFEKRLRKLEESVHLVVAGLEYKEEPCAENFTRVGDGCYHVSAEPANWKGASYGCRRLKSNMLEIDSDHEKQQLTASILSNKKYKDLNTDRGFILINPEEDPNDGGSGNDGKPPKICSLAKCVWLFKHIRSLLCVLSGSIVYVLLHCLARRIIPSIVLTGAFAKASLKVANNVQLGGLFPMHKINKPEWHGYKVIGGLHGADFWTGGLNPGLLWIWSHSARPVANNATSTPTIVGEGRCLAWVSDPARNELAYRGQDCALKHRYICEKEEDRTKLSNDIERVARKIREGRKPKILWTDDEP